MPRPARPARVAIGLVSIALAAASCTTGAPKREDPAAIARTYVEAGRMDEAAREIDLAVRARPDDPELRVEAARIHEQAGHQARAIGHLEVGMQLAPSNPEIWILLGELENIRENVADAYVAYRRAAELAPDDIRAVSGLALAADTLGFEDEANRAYARWAELEQQQQRQQQRRDSPRRRR